MRQLDFTEYEQVQRVPLNRPQRDSLLGCGGGFSIAPEPGTDNLWSLKAGSYVGTVIGPGLCIRIRPKLNIARLFVMLSAASGSIHWDERTIQLAPSSSVEDIVAMALTRLIRRALVSGMLRGYVTKPEDSFVVRGKLDLVGTTQRRPATMLPLAQAPEFLDEDIPENRILASALNSLVRRVTSPLIKRRVTECQRAFDGVTPIRSGIGLPEVRRNRLNSNWWSAIELALLVLQAGGLDLPQGSRTSNAFLVDMNVVFERFVFQSLSKELKPLGQTLVHNRSGLHLDSDGLHGLRPDLSIWSGLRCVYAADCKYKYAESAVAKREDIYQCLAYAAATGLREISLIYGGGSQQSRDVVIVDGRTTVRVRLLNLGAQIDELRRQFWALAAEATRVL